MPVATVERLNKRVSTLRKKITDKADQKATAAGRTLRKRLKRAQRKARRLTAEAARHAPKAEKSES